MTVKQLIKYLSRLPSDAIVRIYVENPDENTIVLQRFRDNSGHWQKKKKSSDITSYIMKRMLGLM